jgi:hypothetical protein
MLSLSTAPKMIMNRHLDSVQEDVTSRGSAPVEDVGIGRGAWCLGARRRREPGPPGPSDECLHVRSADFETITMMMQVATTANAPRARRSPLGAPRFH